MLTQYCRSVLELLLRPDFPGVESLRRQLPLIEGESVDEFGNVVVYLPQGTERATVVDPYPVEASWAKRGRALTLILFVDDGLLSGVEVLRSGYDDEELPPLDEFKFYVRRFKDEEFNKRISPEDMEL